MFKHQAIIVLAALLAFSAQTLLTEACYTKGGDGGNSGLYHIRVSRSIAEGLAVKVTTDAANPGPVAEVKSTVNAKDAGYAGVIPPTVNLKPTPAQ